MTIIRADRRRLFDTLSELPPATSMQIADAAGWDERYVREMLDGFVDAKIVEYEKVSRTYRLSVPSSAADDAP
jgi:DNA-binding IclR family transcriptional regulator